MRLVNIVKSILKRGYIKINEKKIESHYERVLNSIRNRGDRKIRLAVFVIYDSTYGFDRVFRRMSEPDSIWEPKVVIIPDIHRGKEFATKTYCRTKEYMISLYGSDKVLDGWNLKDKYYDLVDGFDLVYFCNPYDVLVHKYHRIRYAAVKSVLPFYITYGYDISSYYTYGRLESLAINLLWRCYTDTEYSYQDYQERETRKGRNVKLIGYSKMDTLNDALALSKSHERKTILITPHHAVDDVKLPLSNFLSYSDLFLKLPKMFSNIDFIFRPHPLLFVNLVNSKLWTEDMVNSYIRQLSENGIEYSVGGSYFDLFSKADAIINDSGSFTVEWLLTGKPGCFVKNPLLSEKQLTTLMNKAISEYTVANTEEDIIAFVKMIDKGFDSGNCHMKDWVRKDIAINYPNVSDELLKDLEGFFI